MELRSPDIPSQSGHVRKAFALGELLQRAGSSARAGWTDLPDNPGIYVVYWPSDEPLTFQGSAGLAISAQTANPLALQEKWKRISSHAPTDIIYIGKGDNLRKRVRALARFGVGKAVNHHGGEWMWQVRGIENGRVLVQTCSAGKQVAFEGWLLERFAEQHREWPLANRKGPDGEQRWHP